MPTMVKIKPITRPPPSRSSWPPRTAPKPLPLDIIEEVVRVGLGSSRENPPNRSRIPNQEPLAKYVELAAGCDDVGLGDGLETPPLAPPVSLQPFGEVEVFHADVVLVEPANRLKILPQAPSTCTPVATSLTRSFGFSLAIKCWMGRNSCSSRTKNALGSSIVACNEMTPNGPLENRLCRLACFAFLVAAVLVPAVSAVPDTPVLPSPPIHPLLKGLPSPTTEFVQAMLSWVWSFRLPTLVGLVKRLSHPYACVDFLLPTGP